MRSPHKQMRSFFGASIILIHVANVLYTQYLTKKIPRMDETDSLLFQCYIVTSLLSLSSILRCLNFPSSHLLHISYASVDIIGLHRFIHHNYSNLHLLKFLPINNLFLQQVCLVIKNRGAMRADTPHQQNESSFSIDPRLVRINVHLNITGNDKAQH